MPIYLLILILFCSTTALAEVYRSVDEHGNTVYSDKPSPDAEIIQVDEVQTVDSGDVEPFVYTPLTDDTEKVSPYTQVAINSPGNNESIRANDGDISVSLDIKPGLIPGHKVVLYVDGTAAAEGGKEIKLENVDRGTHSLSAAIQASDGREIERSPAVTFTVLRHSVQNPAAGGGNPPPKPNAN